MAPALAIADTKHRGRSWGISPAIERARASREKAVTPAPAPRAEPKPAPIEAPAIVPPSIEITGRVLATFATYDGLQAAVRARADELQLTRLELDHLSGNQPGYSSKLMCQPPMKRFGRQSLGDTLGAVGVFLALVEDREQIAKLKAIIDLCAAAAALGVTREEFEQVAGSGSKTNMGALGGTLVAAGCRLALVEDAAATAKTMARAEKRQRALREVKHR